MYYLIETSNWLCYIIKSFTKNQDNISCVELSKHIYYIEGGMGRFCSSDLQKMFDLGYKAETFFLCRHCKRLPLYSVTWFNCIKHSTIYLWREEFLDPRLNLLSYMILQTVCYCHRLFEYIMMVWVIQDRSVGRTSTY